MEEKPKILHKEKLIIIIVVSCVLAFIGAWLITLQNLSKTLSSESYSTVDHFTSIMDDYEHSFLLYEKYLQLEISKASSGEEIAAFLKSNDKNLQSIEGDDYDGVYMYYKGQYLYSWDTPYSTYEESGYEATERPWYTGAVEAAGEVCFSVPYRSYANEYMLATISRLQPDGETVIAYDIKLGAIQSFAEKMSLYKDALTMVCDNKGNIIGTTNVLYSGGNYMLTSEENEQLIKEAENELETASDDEQEKSRKKVESLDAVRNFDSKYQECILESKKTPDKLHIHIGRGVLAYLHTNGSYSCITLVPIMRVMPTVILIWMLISVILILSVLLLENINMRLMHANELKMKNEQLAEAVLRADAASVAKSQFLAQMSHEIRTPMNAVIGLTGIAKTEIRSPEKVADYLTKIEGSSRLLLSIINDVLDMSAIEGGKLKIDSAEFNFKGLLSNITTVFYEQARQKGITFEVRMNGVTEEKIIGDELRVNQILMNLLSNAIKFTPANGEIDLMVLQASRSQDKVQMRFSVSDTGCGMSEEMLGRLFKPFEQESASTARKHGGSGLGLSITKKLTEMMGGTIQVKSTQGKGSVFTVDIPFKVTNNVNDHVTPTDFSKIHALVVDDSEDSCEYSGILLERLGVRYEYVTNGEAALEALENAEDQDDPYTLCLIDWKMPEMDGGELTQQIREIFGEDTIIIIVSAYDLNEVEASGRSIGSNYFIPKPLFQSTLFNALMKISGGDYTKIEVQNEDQNYDFSGKHVLIAEDVALNMEVAVKLLKMVGVEATCAEDGRQAVDLFVQGKPGQYDCILLDINMPVMDGYEAGRAIRKYNRADAATIPIYAMTANAFAEDVTAALNAGMNGHIAKPIETKVLYKTLDLAFAMNKNTDAQTSPESEEKR